MLEARSPGFRKQPLFILFYFFANSTSIEPCICIILVIISCDPHQHASQSTHQACLALLGRLVSVAKQGGPRERYTLREKTLGSCISSAIHP